LPAPLCAQNQQGMDEFPEAAVAAPRRQLDDLPLLPQSPFPENAYPQSLDDFAIDSGFAHDALCPPTDYLPVLGWLGLRHAHTHGRHIGRGQPLVGTSWLNRPYYAGAELGPLWINRSIHDDVSRDTDAFGGIFLGWDRDPYWGAELRFNWATPELINHQAPDANRTDSLFMWSYSLLYYPWGDAKWRPYWRAGIGDTHVDFPLADGTRHDQWMLTFPIGVGVKYPVRRWLAARAEITDHVGLGHDRASAQNNLTLTVGLEWRFGAHPRSYWPWQPSRHIW
jgi:Outer membrane protein beta-barrel domain